MVTKNTRAKRKPGQRSAAVRVADPEWPEQVPAVRSTRAGPFIVGIGASAGGLRALEAFFDVLPNDIGMAFVVITHQPVKPRSMLPDLLSRRTRMQVTPARDGLAIEANQVYVCPAGQNLALLDGAFQIMPPASGPGPHLPIDYFFRSLARDQKERAICAVLSGTGTDGTLGLRAIKGQGGIAIVQDCRTADFTGMPESAAGTQLADHVLAPGDMPKQLLAYARMARTLASDDAVDSGLDGQLPKIFVLLRDRTGHDFSGYKVQTLKRRIERRMRVHLIDRAREFCELLHAQPHELDSLFRELLIAVTHFFRDPDAYHALAARLSTLIEAGPSGRLLRIWVPGCSTGEEAYSIAILATEAAERAGKQLQIQIFATDLDAQVLDVARTGRYAAGIAADVSSERLQRFFVRDGDTFRIQQQIRDRVVFAVQNVLSDPPFTKLDVLSCRNLLIYLNPELQKRALSIFHYALKPGGLLWLGTSETVADHDELFAPKDRKHKIYERRAAARRNPPTLDLGARAATREAASLQGVGSAGPLNAAGKAIEALLLDRFVPPTVVVNDRGDIVYIYGRTGAYLEPNAGVPGHNLYAMARPGLQLSVRAALRRAADEKREVVQRKVSVRTNGAAAVVDIVADRISDPESLRGLFRVTFRPAERASEAQRPKRHGGKPESEMGLELRNARGSLHAAVRQLQSSNQELHASNHELQSTNEELQSSNEELETSKEEMHALNEELQTLNRELQLKIDALDRANDDMQNLIDSTELATLFLDRELNIKRFTEPVRRIVRLVPADVGRPIADLVANVRYDGLAADAQRVLSTQTPHEVEIQTHDGNWLLVQLTPYRTAQNVVDGVLLTFMSIDRVKRAEILAASRAT